MIADPQVAAALFMGAVSEAEQRRIEGHNPFAAEEAKRISAERKATPIASGVLFYFPDALAEVARLSKAGNDKHNPGEPLHWSRGKSNDHADCIARHLIDAGPDQCAIDEEDGILHATKTAWRALANLQVVLEKIRGR